MSNCSTDYSVILVKDTCMRKLLIFHTEMILPISFMNRCKKKYQNFEICESTLYIKFGRMPLTDKPLKCNCISNCITMVVF